MNRLRSSIITTALGGVLVAYLAACAEDETVAAYGAQGQLWHLTGTRSPLTLRFAAGGKIYGATACRDFTARNHAPYPWLDAKQLTQTTAKPCADPTIDQHRLRQLLSMREVEVSEPFLILSRGNGPDMIFTSAATEYQ